MNQTHRGARPTNPLSQASDRRVLELDEALRAVESNVGSSTFNFVRDSVRAGATNLHALDRPGKTVRGQVIHALPHMHWYKVQMGGLGFQPCCALSTAGLVPMGVRNVGTYAPNSAVLVFMPDGLTFGIILGAIPPMSLDNSVVLPDWLTQGGGAGLFREDAHKFPIKGTYQSGGVLDWSAGRPLDETAFDFGWISATGLRIVLNDYEIQIAVNEMCGVWFNYIDSYTRLAGSNLDVVSSVHSESTRDDEGEARYARGIATYPWEAIGKYTPDAEAFKSNDDQAVQYELFEAKVDLVNQDTQPFYRFVEYGGYLGQGHLRAIVTPRYKLILNLAHPLPYPFASDLYASATWQGVLKRKDEMLGNRTVKNYLQRPRWELFDLETDPHELKNLADSAAHQETLAQLQAKLKAWQKETRDPWITKHEYE